MYPDQQNPWGQQRPQQPGNIQPVIPAAPAAGNNGHNPYEFIVANNTRRRTFPGLGWLTGSGNPLIKRLIVVVAGAVVVVVVISILASMLGPKSTIPALTAIAQRQQEIIRVAELASEASDQDTKNFIANTNASIASSQQQLIAYLSTHNAQPKPEILALNLNSQTDTLLTDAASPDSYDNAVVQNLTTQLQTCQSLIRDAYDQTSNKNTKELLQRSFASVQQLLTQAKKL